MVRSFCFAIAALLAAAPVAGAPPAPDPLRAKLQAAGDLLRAHKPADALPILDEVIAAEEAQHGGEAHAFSARSPTESLMYLLAAAKDHVETKVYDDTWSLAYFLKGYALIDSGQAEAAVPLLRRALALAPMNANYLNEFGEYQKSRKDFAAAYATFTSAADASEFSPADVKPAEQHRAWRGMAFALSEQGKFDEAADLYRKCLAADPGDKHAQAELDWIAKHKPK